MRLVLFIPALLAAQALGVNVERELEPRQSRFGEEVGNCLQNQCCSEAGFCGTSSDYCKSPQCQIQYSNRKCDSE